MFNTFSINEYLPIVLEVVFHSIDIVLMNRQLLDYHIYRPLLDLFVVYDHYPVIHHTVVTHHIAVVHHGFVLDVVVCLALDQGLVVHV